MSIENPTTLRIGQTGRLFDREYTVKGRVVLSMDEDGQRWYWNEYFLKAADGSDATLVYEQTEEGSVWRLFYYYEPKTPLTIERAQRVRVGESIEVDRFRGAVDLVGSSRVRHIEGEAPEGVEEGDDSRYFNANSAGTILVVSWAQGEVEHYLGQNLTPSLVKAAFPGVASRVGVSQTSATHSGGYTRNLSSGHTTSASGAGTAIVVLVVIGIIVLMISLVVASGTSRSANFKPRALAVERLSQGRTQTLAGLSYRVKSSALIEFATAKETRVGRVYLLTDEAGNSIRLLQSCHAKPELCWWHESAQTTRFPKAQGLVLARVAPTQKFTVDGKEYVVRETLRWQILKHEYGDAQEQAVRAKIYGVIAVLGSETYLFEWTEDYCRQTLLREIAQEQLK